MKRSYYSMVVFTMLCHAVCAQAIKERIDSLNQASTALQRSQPSKSFELAKEAVALSNVHRYDKGLFEGYLCLAANFFSKDSYDSALHYTHAARAGLTVPEKIGMAEYYLGAIYGRLRQDARAEQHLAEADRIFAKNKLQHLNALVANTRGTMKGRQGDYNGALNYFLQAAEILRSLNRPYGVEMSNIALAYKRLGNFEKSKSFAQQALKIAMEEGDSLNIVRRLTVLGDAQKSIKQYDSAFLCYDQAWLLATKHNFPEQKAYAWINKASLLMDLDMPEEGARLLRDVVYDLDQSNSAQDLRTSSSRLLASAYHKLGRHDSAIWFANHSLRLSTSSKSAFWNSENTFLLYNIYKDLGQKDSALRYADLFIGYREELQEENKEAEFSDLRVQIETLEKDAEINALQLQSQLSSLRNQRLVLGIVSLTLVGGLLIAFLYSKQRIAAKKNEVEQHKLKAEIDKNKENLYKQTLHMIHLGNCFDEIQSQVKEMMNNQVDVRLSKISNLIKTTKALQSDWKNFNEYFSNVHSGFYERLTRLSPALTQHEKRVCALLKLHLSTREIATLLNIESKSVLMIKYRIKKKLNMAEADNLEAFAQQL